MLVIISFLDLAGNVLGFVDIDIVIRVIIVIDVCVPNDVYLAIQCR